MRVKTAQKLCQKAAVGLIMKHMANQFLGLSLFIMLLAFFIILNAISTFEDTKSRPVLNSLMVAFSNRDPTELIPPGPTLEKSPMFNLGSTLDKLEALFQSQISEAQTKQNRLGTTMYLRMPFEPFRDAVYSSLSAAPQAPVSPIDDAQVNLLPMLVSLLETGDSVAYKMDMILNINDDPALLVSEGPEVYSIHNNAISGIARRITDAGLPTKQITAGIRQGDEGYVNLVFRRYEPFNPTRSGIEEQEETSAEEAPAETVAEEETP